MTISTTTVRNTTQGPGSTGTFSFKITSASDIIVYKTSAAGTETALAYPSDYTVSGVGDAAGGTVTLAVALVSGEQVDVVRTTPSTQPTSLRTLGTFLPGSHEDAFDRLTMIAQQHDDALARTVRVPRARNPADFDLELVPETGKALVWQSSTALGNATLDGGAVAIPGGGRTVDTLSAYLANNAEFRPTDFNATGDDTDDDTAELQDCLNAAAAMTPRGHVVIDRPYKVTATTSDVPGGSGKYALLVQDGISIEWRGQGQIRCVTDGATVLAVAGSGGTAADHVADVTLWYPRIVGGDSTNNGIGRGIFFYRADRCAIIGGDVSACRVGIQFDRLSSDNAYNVGNRVLGTVVHDTFGTTTGNGTAFFVSGCDQLQLTGIQGINVAEHGLYISQNTRRVTVSGNFQPSVSSNQNCGVQIYSAEAAPDIDAIDLSGVHVTGAKWGILASSGGGGGVLTRINVRGGSASDCLTNGLIYSGVEDSLVDGLQVTGTTAGNGLEADASKRIHVRGCTSQRNGLNGLLLDGSTDCQIEGGSYVNNDQANGGNSGIRLANASTGAKLSGLICTDDQGSKTQDYAITIDADASNADIDNVTVSGNATGTFVTNGATGTRIRNCRGYNPVGVSAISVGASPYTYTAGASPETVHIFGGTVSSVTKGGTQIASSSNVAVHMEPNESLIVTYASGPSMTKDIH